MTALDQDQVYMQPLVSVDKFHIVSGILQVTQQQKMKQRVFSLLFFSLAKDVGSVTGDDRLIGRLSRENPHEH